MDDASVRVSDAEREQDVDLDLRDVVIDQWQTTLAGYDEVMRRLEGRKELEARPPRQ